MWFRYLIIALGAVLLIGGCNGLLSQLFGTHKLRQFTLSEVRNTGLGDADYIALDSVQWPEEYVIGAALHGTDRDIIIYPFVSLGADTNEQVTVVAWRKVSLEEAADGPPYPHSAGSGKVKGLVRPPNPRKDVSAQLAQFGYQIPESVYYLEVSRAPLSWYWYALMIIGGIGIAGALEARAFRRRQKYN